jgi:hypothetical protein
MGRVAIELPVLILAGRGRRDTSQNRAGLGWAGLRQPDGLLTDPPPACLIPPFLTLFERLIFVSSRLLRTGLPLLLAAIPSLLLTSHAQAASYDGQDPRTSGCANGAYVAKSATDRYYSSMYGQTVSVQANLWYSPTCRTVWAVVDNTVPGQYWSGMGCNVWRNSDGKRYGCSRQSGTNEMYSMMLNDKDVTSYATAWSYIGNDPHEMYARTGSF